MPKGSLVIVMAVTLMSGIFIGGNMQTINKNMATALAVMSVQSLRSPTPSTTPSLDTSVAATSSTMSAATPLVAAPGTPISSPVASASSTIASSTVPTHTIMLVSSTTPPDLPTEVRTIPRSSLVYPVEILPAGTISSSINLNTATNTQDALALYMTASTSASSTPSVH